MYTNERLRECDEAEGGVVPKLYMFCGDVDSVFGCCCAKMLTGIDGDVDVSDGK